MGKKHRSRKTTVYIVAEGHRERYFLEYLIEIFNPRSNNINITTSPNYGGTPESIIDEAIRNQHYKKIYAWLDEDTPLQDSDDTDSYNIYQRLKSAWNLPEDIDGNTFLRDLQARYNPGNRNPILIISNPLSVEGFIIKLFNKRMPQFKQPYLNAENLEENKTMIKCAVAGIFGASSDGETELAYYREHLSKEMLEVSSREIPESALLLSIFQNNS